MDIIISHKSALEYWRLHSDAKITDCDGNRCNSLPASIPKSAVIRKRAPSGLSYPINLLVANQNAKRKSKIVKPRVYAGPTPSGCFISIGDMQFVSAPPFCFFQMAYELPLVKLIELGFELCGSYSLNAKIDYGCGSKVKIEYANKDADDNKLGEVEKTSYGHKQLTSIKAIKALADHMIDVNGKKKVLRALRYIINGSASPMETILVMLLTLSHKLGGYELPAPELNKCIDLKSTVKQRSREPIYRPEKSYYICDLYWPKAKLAVEYDSDSYHTGADRIARDSKKRLDLDALGITVITVTSRQIRYADEFETLAMSIAKKLHKRVRYRNPQFQQAERELRGLLLNKD